MWPTTGSFRCAITTRWRSWTASRASWRLLCPLERVQTPLPTMPHVGWSAARTLAVDAANGSVYTVPAALGRKPPATKDNPKARPAVLPGGFVVLVVVLGDAAASGDLFPKIPLVNPVETGGLCFFVAKTPRHALRSRFRRGRIRSRPHLCSAGPTPTP